MPSGYVNCLAVDPTDSDNVIAVFSNYNLQSLWYSTNGGSSWTDVEGNLSGATGPSVRWATIFYVRGTSHYFLGTSVGVYFTNTLNGAQNDGHSEPDLSGEESWEKIGFIEGHGNSNSPKSYEFVDKNVLYGKHYYRLKQIDNDGSFEYSDVVEVDVPTLQDYVILEQNYPNPFNPETKIRFVVNENTQVTLKVFDAVGIVIAEIFNNIVDPGKIYEINFDGSLLSSSVYYYSLTAGNHKEIRKILLPK